MTTISAGRAPGDESGPARAAASALGAPGYTMGSCSRSSSPPPRSGRRPPTLSGARRPAALAVLAIAQMGVHLVFFLHITTAPDNTNNVLALAFGILIVILIMAARFGSWPI